jgi:hypothetical protein
MFTPPPCFSDAILYVSGSAAIVGGLAHTVIAQVVPEAMPAVGISGDRIVGIVGVIGGLIGVVTPLVLRVVDLQRLRESLKQHRHHARNLEQRIYYLDVENRRMRDTMVRMSRAHNFDLPEWFYSEPTPPTAPPGTGDYPILPPDPPEAIGPS